MSYKPVLLPSDGLVGSVGGLAVLLTSYTPAELIIEILKHNIPPVPCHLVTFSTIKDTL